MLGMVREFNNYAFIDGQNLHLGIRKLGWHLDYVKFRTYLQEKYNVRRAYFFIGFMPANQKLYDWLRKSGFILVFKPAVSYATGKIKGNVDADLVLKAAMEFNAYDKAVIVSSDGDFYSLVDVLYAAGKLAAVISPDIKHCSWLLRRKAKDKIEFMNKLKLKLAYQQQRGTA